MTKRKTKKSRKPKVENVPEPEPVPEPPSKPVRVRRVVDRDTVLEGFELLHADILKEVASLKENSDKKRGKTGIRFLKHICSRLNRLKLDSARVMKKKTKTRAKNTNSGFMKPVPISKEMCKFTGWDQKEPKSRVAVTKYICNYIKEHDLQNPEDRRQIRPNSKLTKLLRIKSDDEPLTYYSLQKKIQHHFIKNI